MNSYSSPSLGSVSASSLHEAARLLAGRTATAKYGRNGRVVSHFSGKAGHFTAVIGAEAAWESFHNKIVIFTESDLSSIHAEVIDFTVEMVGKPQTQNEEH